MITFTGTLTAQQRGCTEGAGQDYVRLTSPAGVIELHPTYNTSGTLLEGLPAQMGIDLTTGSIGTGWDFTYGNLNILSVASFGVLPVFGVIVAFAAGTGVGISLFQQAVPVGWIVGAKINVGIKRL